MTVVFCVVATRTAFQLHRFLPQNPSCKCAALSKLMRIHMRAVAVTGAGMLHSCELQVLCWLLPVCERDGGGVGPFPFSLDRMTQSSAQVEQMTVSDTKRHGSTSAAGLKTAASRFSLKHTKNLLGLCLNPHKFFLSLST